MNILEELDETEIEAEIIRDKIRGWYYNNKITAHIAILGADKIAIMFDDLIEEIMSNADEIG
jgi:hypothetical protein